METKHPLRSLREHHNYSLNDLAGATGLSKRTILRAEQGYAISPSSRNLLCAYFTKLEEKQITSQHLGLIRVVQEQSTSKEKQSVLAVEATEAMEMNKKRRDFIITALQLSGAALALPFSKNLENLEQSALTVNNSPRIGTPALTYLESAIDSCWYLSNTNKITEVEQILPILLPHLVTLAHQPSRYQQRAAHLASQGYILAAEVDRGNIHVMKAYCQQAVLYSQIAEDTDIQVAALKQQATIHLVGRDPTAALQKYEEALLLINHVSPLLRSRVYLGLASVKARCQQKQDALRYIGLARQSFPGHPEQDPNYLYTVCNEPVLYLYEALTYTDLEQPNDAWEALLAVDGLKPKMPVSTSTRIEFLNLQAKTAAELGDINLSIAYLSESIQLSHELGYNLWLNEAQEIYQEIAEKWPKESKIRVLRDLF